jgi:hypothetical protein
MNKKIIISTSSLSETKPDYQQVGSGLQDEERQMPIMESFQQIASYSGNFFFSIIVFGLMDFYFLYQLVVKSIPK